MRRGPIEIPVDSTLTQLAILSEPSAGRTVTIIKPTGDLASEANGELKTGVLRSLRAPFRAQPLYTIERPQPGIWRVQLSGVPGSPPVDYSLVAFGKSSLDFESVDFVRFGGDGVHGGYMPASGAPVLGAVAVVEAQVSEGLRNPTFQTVDDDGNVLQALALSDAEWVKSSFVGPLPMPSGAFGLLMTATDATGAKVQRRSSETFRGQPLEVRFVQTGPAMLITQSARMSARHMGQSSSPRKPWSVR